MEVATNLLELLQQPPTIVIYRPDGQLSLDQLRGMSEPNAIVCFRSETEARQYLDPKLKGFRVAALSFEQWLEAISGEAEKGRTHLAIFQSLGDSILKSNFKISDVFSALKCQEGNQ